MVRLSPLVEEKSDNALIADLIAHVMSLEARLRREREGGHATGGSITAGGAVLVFMPGVMEIVALGACRTNDDGNAPPLVQSALRHRTHFFCN